MRYFYFNPPVSVKPSALPRISWTARTSMPSTLPLTGARTAAAIIKENQIPRLRAAFCQRRAVRSFNLSLSLFYLHFNLYLLYLENYKLSYSYKRQLRLSGRRAEPLKREGSPVLLVRLRPAFKTKKKGVILHAAMHQKHLQAF